MHQGGLLDEGVALGLAILAKSIVQLLLLFFTSLL